MKPFDPFQPVMDFAAASNYVQGGASGIDLPPALTGCLCCKCGNSFQPSADGRIRAFDRDGGAVCEACK